MYYRVEFFIAGERDKTVPSVVEHLDDERVQKIIDDNRLTFASFLENEMAFSNMKGQVKFLYLRPCEGELPHYAVI